jgi:hypothetical protein
LKISVKSFLDVPGTTVLSMVTSGEDAAFSEIFWQTSKTAFSQAASI